MNGTIDKDEMRMFLTEQFEVVEETGGVSIVSLMHHAHTGPIELLSLKTGHPKWNNPEGMATLFDAYAARHAKGVVGGGAQQYELTVCRGGDNRPSSVLPFIRVGATNVTGPSGSLATEPPTEIGRLQQAQRWGEQITQMTFQSLAGLQHSQQAAIDARDRRINEVEKTNGELWIACKQLLLELDKQRHDVRMQELAAMRAAEFQRHLMALAPALINMMTGKDVFPSIMAEESVFEGLAAGSTPEQIRAFTAFVSTQVKNGEYLAGVINDRYQKYHDKQARLQAEEKRLMRMTPGAPSYDEAERDAAGEAMRVLKGESPTAPKLPPAAKEAPKGSNGGTEVTKEATNGTSGDVTATPSKDTALIERLFAKVPEGMIGALAATLAAEDPELAQMIQARYAEGKKA